MNALAYTPEEYWSSTPVTLARSCLRAYGFEWFEGRKEPELEWADVENERVVFTSRQRSLALGKAVHSVFEAWFQGQPIDWVSFPAQRAHPGMAKLPHPSQCRAIHVETQVRLDTRALCPEITEALSFGGRMDLVLQLADGRWLLVDYKTCVDFKWQKGPAELIANLQANIYALFVMQQLGLNALDCRWVYLHTRGRAESRVTDFRIRRSDAERIVAEAIREAAELRTLMRKYKKGHLRVLDLTPNHSHCEAFGGCPHHAARGGPCDGAFSPEALKLAQAEKVKMTNTFMDRVANLTGAPAPVAVVAGPAAAYPPAQPTLYYPPAAPAAAQTTLDHPAGAEPVDPPKRKAGRPKGSKNKVDVRAVQPNMPVVIETTGVEVEGPPTERPAALDTERPQPPLAMYTARLRLIAWHESKEIRIELPAPEQFKGLVEAILYGVTGIKAEDWEK